MRRLLVTVVLCGAIAAHAEPPDPAAVEAGKKHFAAGQKLFDAGDLKGAVDELKEAYRLTKNPLLLYNLAFVYDKMNDAPLALHFYSKFIDDAEDNDKNHDRLVDAGKRAAALKAGLAAEAPSSQPSSAPASAPASLPARVVGLEHDVIDQAPPGRPVDITARVPDEAGWTVTLFYRGAGEDLYQQVRMRPQLGLLVGRIPAAAVHGNAVHYYLAARDPDGKLVAGSGKASTPNIIYLDSGAPLHALIGPADSTNEPAPLRPVHVDQPGPSVRPLLVAKWTASGGAVVLAGAAVVFALAARSNADLLATEAAKSQTDECAPLPPPCRPYSQPRKDLEATGKNDERWSNILLVAGAAAALAAGAFWYLDARAEPAATPLLAPGTVGAAAKVQF
jgi:hypothetical protein